MVPLVTTEMNWCQEHLPLRMTQVKKKSNFIADFLSLSQLKWVTPSLEIYTQNWQHLRPVLADQKLIQNFNKLIGQFALVVVTIEFFFN